MQALQKFWRYTARLAELQFLPRGAGEELFFPFVAFPFGPGAISGRSVGRIVPDAAEGARLRRITARMQGYLLGWGALFMPGLVLVMLDMRFMPVFAVLALVNVVVYFGLLLWLHVASRHLAKSDVRMTRADWQEQMKAFAARPEAETDARSQMRAAAALGAMTAVTMVLFLLASSEPAVIGPLSLGKAGFLLWAAVLGFSAIKQFVAAISAPRHDA